MSRTTLVILLKYVLGLGILAAFGYRNWDVVQADGVQVGLSVILIKPINVGAFGIGLLICAVGVALTFVRWYYLIVAQDLPITPLDVARLGLLGFFFNTFLPGSIGGDGVKAAFLAREQSRRTLAIATVVLDRVIGFAGLFWLAALLGGTLFLTGSFERMLESDDSGTARATLQYIVAFSGTVVAGSIVFWAGLGLFSGGWLDRQQERLEGIPKIGHSLAELVRAVRVYRQKGRFVALALGLSLLGHFCFVLGFYCAARVFSDADQIPPLLAHLLIVPIGMTIRAMVPLPGGMGGAELGYGNLYKWVGSSFVSGVLSSIGQLAFMFILGLIGFVAYQVIDAKSSRRREPPKTIT